MGCKCHLSENVSGDVDTRRDLREHKTFRRHFEYSPLGDEQCVIADSILNQMPIFGQSVKMILRSLWP